MENRWCSACGMAFLPRAQAPHQTYCQKPECQRERRRLWQQAKRHSDPDYLENQLQAQRAWARRNPQYWRDYRQRHPKYEALNRDQQHDRNLRRKLRAAAKMDVSLPASPLIENGLYEIRAIDQKLLARMGVWTVRIAVISTDAGPLPLTASSIAKR